VRNDALLRKQNGKKEHSQAGAQQDLVQSVTEMTPVCSRASSERHSQLRGAWTAVVQLSRLQAAAKLDLAPGCRRTQHSLPGRQ
jgi:hypothetical protein